MKSSTKILGVLGLASLISGCSERSQDKLNNILSSQADKVESALQRVNAGECQITVDEYSDYDGTQRHYVKCPGDDKRKSTLTFYYQEYPSGGVTMGTLGAKMIVSKTDYIKSLDQIGVSNPLKCSVNYGRREGRVFDESRLGCENHEFRSGEEDASFYVQRQALDGYVKRIKAGTRSLVQSVSE